MSKQVHLPLEFGPYRILGKISEGGMGTVFLAEHPQLGRVALKVPHLDAGGDQLALERFKREARLAATIHHHTLCPVYDSGEIGDIPYLAMPFLEGTPLSKHIQRGKPWPVEQAIALTVKLAWALQFLHERGIIHRDVKPANVMIRPTGDLVLMDFGLARSFTDPGERLTVVSTTLGTPEYMSPEQVLAEQDLGPASDVYSLGIILYELLTGHVPFGGPPSSVFGQVLAARPEPPTTLRPDLEPALSAVCLKAIAKAPADRYPSAAAFAAALASPRQQGGGRKHSWALIGTLICTALLATAALWWLVLSAPEPEPEGPSEPTSRPTTALRWESPQPVTIRAGRSATIPLRIVRVNGASGDVVVDVFDAPAGVKLQVTPPRQKEEGSAELRVAPGTAPGRGIVRLLARTGELQAETKLEVTVEAAPRVVRPGLAWEKLLPLTLKAGESRTFEVHLRRLDGCPGRIEVQPERLPPAVEFEGLPIPEGDVRGKFTLKAGPAAPAGRHTVVLLARAGEVREKTQLDLTIQWASPPPLPRDRIVLKRIPGGMLPDGRSVRTFEMSAHEITVGQFRKFVRATGYKTEAEKDGRGWGYNAEAKCLETDPRFTWESTGWEQTDDHPVVNVTWRDADAFCKWLSKTEGKSYDLPTDAEWEYAFRSSSRRDAANAPAELIKIANIADKSMRDKFPDLRWPLRELSDGKPFTAAVGSFPADNNGLYDLHGNVAEWCRDPFDAEKARGKDPRDPENKVELVCRGGTWYHNLAERGADHREGCLVTHRHCTLGFRVVVRSASGTP
jgi:formylglycine-generating enzyme required for sulfatase activity